LLLQLLVVPQLVRQRREQADRQLVQRGPLADDDDDDDRRV
jgi:hypothetical protein